MLLDVCLHETRENHVSDVFLLVIGIDYCLLDMFGYWLLVVGYGLWVIGYWLLFYWLWVMGYYIITSLEYYSVRQFKK